ncbi:MAG: MotA/TolQ/ExbB proton channel family protein [Gammaproteobacteria bacterium]|nr:MAG: MotA/TolQ/ExbB proton channel family protein [Gammaproteobacteria bacterium]RKZ74887.1 MAG: MotA/TolQ/ExbB proton channel family protein [Gammaproteobacteria bacterium]
MEFLHHSDRLTTFLQNLNTISLSVIVILLLMSLLSWYLIMRKTLQLGFTYWRSNKILKLFWHSSSLEPIITRLAKTKATDPFSNVALQGINAAIFYEKRVQKQLAIISTHNEFITRNMRRAINEGSTQLNSGLTILATVGSTAPFIGLLGTVIGIYEALISISTRGNASLDTVSAPVGEALIMTALGLVVAIPAVLGYNALIRGNRAFLNKLEGFAHDLLTCLNTGARMDMKDHAYMKRRIQPAHIKNELGV